MSHSGVYTFRRTDGLLVQAARYDGSEGSYTDIVNWLSAVGAHGQAYAVRDPFAFIPEPTLYIVLDGGEQICLKPGDWITSCNCESGFHAAPADGFENRFAAVPEPVQEPEPQPDRYQRTNALVREDLKNWDLQRIGHYGNEKPGDVLRRAYMDALELALFLREQLDFAENIQGL